MKPWPYPRIIAHRGGGTLAPENTLAGMRKAKEMGYAGVEFDVMLAADATPILMHDQTLERTTSGSGAIDMTAFADMLKLDAGSWFSPEFAGELVLGIRPEHLAVCAAGESLFTLQTEMSEMLGADTLVHGLVAHEPMVARLAAADHPAPGQSLPLRALPGHLHWFDAASGARLESV